MKMKSKKRGENSEERCATGIHGFDSLCEGGFISDSVNLLVGNAGAGKTTFILQFLYNGAVKYSQNGLYVSFEPELADIVRAGRKQGMDFEKLEKEGKCSFIKLPTTMSVREMQNRLTSLVAKNDVKRVCFDPINVFALDLPAEINMRKQIYELVSLLKKLDVCVVIAGESDEEKAEGQALSDEITFSKYLVDGVVEIYSSGLGGQGDRALRIAKMRMTNHARGPVGMQITDSGIKIFNS